MPHVQAALERRIHSRLERLQAEGLQRSLCPPQGVDLCSNDYLQLAADPRLKQRMAEAVLRLGCGSTGSRLLRGERAEFSAIEERFARWAGAESALYFSTGYAANLAVLSTFLEEPDTVLFDRLNHASLIDGIRLGKAKKKIFPHVDLEALRPLLRTPQGDGQTYLVTESLFSMDGDVAPLREYAALCRESGAVLIVDEAHAVGVYGARGTGCIEEAGIGPDVFLAIRSAGKALGVSGAFVTGPAWAIEYLVQRARTFLFSTAPPPAIAEAIDAALDVIAAEPERRARLHAVAAYLRGLLADAGLPVAREGSQIIPVVIGENERAVQVAAALQAEGFDVRAIRPPTVPEGTARLRLSVNTGLDAPTLHRFVACLQAALAWEVHA
jgi:8-amino-7-oxononanoate synthase